GTGFDKAGTPILPSYKQMKFKNSLTQYPLPILTQNVPTNSINQ
ncbi:8992_t:CDS:1, partial [Entrophospora sp. SA101]